LKGKGRSWFLTFLVTPLAFAANDALGQQLLKESSSCNDCQLSLELATVLDDVAGHGHIPVNAVVESDGLGGFYLAPAGESATIIHYGPQGAVRSVLSTLTGDVPPDRRPSMLLALQDESLYVVDNARRELKVLQPQDRRVVEEIQLPANVHSLVPRTRGGVTIQASLRGATYFGLPIHDLSDGGAVAHSFGSDQEIVGLQGGLARQRRLARAVGDSIWSAHVTRYRIDLFDPERQLVRHFHRRVDWFQPWTREPSGSFRSRPPLPRVANIAFSDEGYLQVYLLVPDSEWTPPSPDNPIGVTPEGFSRHFDTLVEVIDPSSGDILATERFDDRVSPTSTGAFAYSIRGSDGPRHEVYVFRVKLTTGTRPSSNLTTPYQGR